MSELGRPLLQLGGTIAGAAFGPIGSAVGGFLGALAGNAIFGSGIPNQYGPRITDLRVQSSNYGRPIPRVWGGYRLAGNVIWSTDLRETARTEEAQTGKGGSGPTVTTYTYDVDFAVALCEGPISGVRRIWLNESLVYDVGDDADIATLRTSYRSLGDSIRVYVGSETQLPDAAIEADKGVGNVPAYRGTAYIVFERLQLEPYGNRVPNVTAEVVLGASTPGARLITTAAITSVSPTPARIFVTDSGVLLSHVDGAVTAVDLDLGNARAGALPRLYRWPPKTSGDYGGQDALGFVAPTTNVFRPGSIAFYTLLLTTLAQQKFSRAYFDGAAWRHGVDRSASICDGAIIKALLPAADRLHVLVLLRDVAAGAGEATRWVLWQYGPAGDDFAEVRRGTIAALTGSAVLAPSAGYESSTTGGLASFAAGMLESDLRHFWQARSDNLIGVNCYSLDADNVLRHVVSVSVPGWFGAGSVSIYADESLCWARCSGDYAVLTRAPALTNPGQPLATVVSELVREAPLTAGDIDVTGLTGTVRGYARTNRMRVRDALAPLAQAFGFDAAESDGKIKFVMRGATPVASIAASELGASNTGEAAAALECERGQEAELPAQLDLTYLSAGADYAPGTQTFRRLAVASTNKETIEVSLVLTDAEAATTVARLGYETWVGRNRRSFAVDRKWSRLEPGDVVDVTDPAGAAYRMRITSKLDTAGLLNLDAVDVDAAAFAATNVAGTVPPGGGVVTLPGDVQLAVVQCLPLRAADATYGYYVAGATHGNWRGAVIQESRSDGADFDVVSSLDTQAVIGQTLTALGRWGIDVPGSNYPQFRGHVVDESSTVEVSLISGALTSCTYAELLQLKNVAAIGNEIVAFRTVTALGSGRYRLQGFLRGLLGTEWYAATAVPGTGLDSYQDSNGNTIPYTPWQRDGHRTGEQFVVLSTATLRRVLGSYDRVGARALVRGVPPSAYAERAEAVEFTAGPEGVLQPPPCALRGRKEGADLRLEWTRRAAVNGGWDSGRDVPLAETAEQYAVRINLVTSGGAAAGNATLFVNGPAPHTVTAAQLASINQGQPAFAFVDWAVAQVPDETPASSVLLGDITTTPQRWAVGARITY